MKTIIFLFLFVIASLTGSSQLSKFDSLKTALDRSAQDTNRVNLLNEIGGRLIKKGVYPEAHNYLSQSISLAEQLNFKRGLTISLNRLGNIYSRQNDNSTALEYYHKALKISEETKDMRSVADVKSNIGIVYSDEGDYEKALREYLDAYTIRESIRDTFGYANSEINIGNIFFLQNNYQKSLDYYLKSLKSMQLLDNKYEIAMLFNNIGLVYSTQKDYQKALDYFFKCLKADEEIGDKDGVANSYSVIGEVLEKQGSYLKALEYYMKSVDIFESLGNKKALAESYALLGIVYDSLNDNAKAKEYFSKQLALAKEIGNKKNIREGYLNLSNEYRKMNDFQNAYKNYISYSAVNDSMFNETNSKLIAETEAKYQNEKKQKEIALLLKENEIKQLDINSGRKTIFVFILATILLVVIGFLFYQWNQLRNRQRLDSEMLKQKEIRIKAIVEAQEEEQVRIAKDLHDGVGQLLTGLKLAWQNIITELNNSKNPVIGKMIESSKVLDQAANEVRDISHQMMPRALSESGLVVAIEDMLNSALKHSSINYDFEHSNISGRFAKEIEVTVFRTTQELINNILKHSGATIINIQLFKNKDQLVLFVEDNGKGFKFDELKQKGLGLMNIITRVKLVNGDVNYEPGPFKGTITTIRIPVE
ncbi:MAG: tetratricopeptide repeat-containing sensor histidine kinase [Bacteroidia bacterium]